MKMSTCQVAIIGAGPYGLAVAAHLRSAGLETWTFGQPMEFWQNQMPAGMLLRSPWEASHIADPHNALTLDEYQKARDICLSRPVPLRDFVAYGRWFQRQAVPDLDTRRVQRLERTSAGFRLVLASSEAVEAQRVVIAAGIGPFAHRPAPFDTVPHSIASHSSEHDELNCFAGRRVIVVGGGQSAIESAALLHEGGADVELVMRSSTVRWLRRSAMLHRFNPLRRLLYHRSDIGPAVLSQLVSRPGWFSRLPLPMQQKAAERSIRPAGSAWLIPRTQNIKITTGRHVVSATPNGNRISIALDDGGTRRVDHVLLGTGYRVDVSRYEFLSPEILQCLSQVNGYPQLARGFESSIPGLHFVGAPAAWSFGPFMRFVAGTQFVARTLTSSIAGKRINQIFRETQWATMGKLPSG